MRSAVLFAAMMPAIRAAASTSPLATALPSTAARASSLILIEPSARAVRAVSDFPPTSTIRARPSASRCESSFI